jgi:4'-phosphopantetheinyl transferase
VLQRPGVDIWRVGLPDGEIQKTAHDARDKLLRRYLRLAPHDPLPMGRSRHGKPFLAAGVGPLDFNLSHTQGMALLAVSGEGSVGIDIERIRPIRDPVRIAQRVWPDAAVRRLVEQPEGEQQQAFFAEWTRFEACQKALGRGVFDPHVDPAGLRTRLFSPAPGYASCLAVVGTEWPALQFFDFRSP